MTSEGRCYCQCVTMNKLASVSAWESFDADAEDSCSKEVVANKGKKQPMVKSRYGYETLDDKYRFSHYSDTNKYMEEYREMFSVANRTHRKHSKAQGNPYRFIPMQLSRARPIVRETPMASANSKECDEVISSSSAKDEPSTKLEEQDIKEKTTPVENTQATCRITSNNTPSQSKSMFETLKMAPTLGDGYHIDYAKDCVKDEYEDEERMTTPATAPLMKQLNSFFLSKYGRRRISHTADGSSNLFPYIHSSYESMSQDLGEMTAASIINYKVPVPKPPRTHAGHRTSTGHRPPTSHPKLSVLKNTEVQHAKFKPMIERQKTQMFPMRMKTINTSNMNHYDHLNSTMQTANHKRFNSISFRNASPTEKGLPKSHILTAKTISKIIDGGSESRQENEVASPMSKPLSAEKIDANSISEKHRRYKQTMHKIVLNYGKNLHPYFKEEADGAVATAVDDRYSKAELVDYSTIVASSYQR